MKPRCADAMRLEAEYFDRLTKALSAKHETEAAEIIQSVREHIDEAVTEIADAEVSRVQASE